MFPLIAYDPHASLKLAQAPSTAQHSATLVVTVQRSTCYHATEPIGYIQLLQYILYSTVQYAVAQVASPDTWALRTVTPIHNSTVQYSIANPKCACVLVCRMSSSIRVSEIGHGREAARPVRRRSARGGRSR